jgi:putative ABC transport system permease protein
MMTRLWLWLRSVLFRTRLERDMQEEMAAHLRTATERFEASGLAPEAARAAAHREFGNLAALEEEARDARGGRGIESVLADLRYGVRRLSRTPFSAITMIVVFALGIGFNAALFIFISSLVNSPVPGMTRDDSLVRIRGVARRAGISIGREFSYPEYRDYASQTTLFASVAAWTSSDVVIGVGGGGVEDVLLSGAATFVTANYFQVLGVHAAKGSVLPANTPDQGGEPPLVAVISHALWEQRFDRAPDIVGRSLKVNDTSVTIVGVAPRRFAGARTGGSQMRVWLPLGTRPFLLRTNTDLTSYDPAFLGLAARLQPGVEPEQMLPTVDAIGARSMQLTTGPQPAGRRSTDVVPMLAGNYFPPSGEAPNLLARASSLMIPLLILLVTCTNVSALLAGLAIARRREIAVRLSLGAARRRIVRQLVTESVLLAVAAGALALLVIWILLRVVESSIADAQMAVDWRTILFTLVVAGLAGVIFGLSPALHGTRVSLSEVLKDSVGGVVVPRSRLQSGLVVAQIALTQPLLLGMGALILEMREDLGKVPSPVHADRVLDVRFNTNPRYGAIDQARDDTLLRLQSRFAALPGVVAVVPQETADDYFEAVVHRADQIGEEPERPIAVRAQAAPAGYFSLMGMPVVRGRDFDAALREDRTSVVIGAATANRLWPGADPIGRRLASISPTRRGTSFTVVGVVDETRAGLRDAGDEIRVFVPDLRITGRFLIRTQAPAQPMLPVIRAMAVAEAPDVPIVSARTLDAIASEQRTSLRRIIAGVGGTGVLALFLSAIGLYAVVAFAVRQRVREIGIRTALGADRQQVVAWFLLRGLKLSLAGMTLGLTLSVIVVRLMAALQGEEPPSGIVGMAAVVGCIAVTVALLATWIPARRAATIDPILALRVE